MTTAETLPKTIKYVYTKSDDHKVIYVNGVHGGVTMQGEIAFDLFLEQRDATDFEVHKIDEDGTLGPRIKSEPKTKSEEQGQIVLIREEKVGIVMSRDAAENIAKWILAKVERLDSHVQQKTSEEEQNADE